MPDIIEINDSDAVVRSKIIAILEFDGISTDDITSWGIATNRLNLAANRLGFNNITNNMPGSEARAIINQLAVSPAPVYPENTVLPTISGNARYNQTLTATTGTWNGYPAPTYSYQWQADEIPIPGATSSTYLIKESDLGKQIRVGVTATNLSGPASVFSNPTAVVTSTPINSSLPTISGTAANGQTLTANNGTWIAFPVPTFTYQWKADGVNIAGAINQTLTLGNNQIGREITVDVTATNSEGFDTKITNATARVTSAPINTVLPLVAAEIVQGKVVTTTSGTWLGYPIPTYAYQWKRNGTNISGATSSSYTPVSADVGQNITVTVTATNSVSAVQATSVAKMAKPTWAETFDAWRNFATNVGDFANPTDIHSSNILMPDSTATYQSFAANILTRTDLGIQTIPTRTNVVTNSTWTGATVGEVGAGGSLPNNMSTNAISGRRIWIDSVGVSFGLPYIDLRVQYTNSSGTIAYPALTFSFSPVPISEGQKVTSSIWYQYLETTSIGVNAAQQVGLQIQVNGTIIDYPKASASNPDGNRYRAVTTHTARAGATTINSPRLQNDVPNGVTIDYKVRLWAPQTEISDFPTAPILTNGTMATVQGNRPSVPIIDGKRAFLLDMDLLEPPVSSSLRYLFQYIGVGDNRYSLVITPSGTASLDVGNGGYLGGAGGLNVIQGRNIIYGVADSGYLRIGRVGLGDVAARTNLLGAGALTSLFFGTSGSSAVSNAFMYTRKFAELRNFSDPAEAFNNVKALAQLAAAQ